MRFSPDSDFADVIYPGLLLGTFRACRDPNFLIANGVTHVLTVAKEKNTRMTARERKEVNTARSAVQHQQRRWSSDHELIVKELDVLDQVDFEIGDFFEEACAFIEDALAPRYAHLLRTQNPTLPQFSETTSVSLPTVLVHCFLGSSRSASIVAAHLMNLYFRLSARFDIAHSTTGTSEASNRLLLRLQGLPDPPSPFPPPEPALRDMVYEHMKAKRGTVWPNQGFWRQLETWESRLAQRFVETEI